MVLLNNGWVLDERLPNDLVADLQRYTAWGRLALPKTMACNDWYIMHNDAIPYLYHCHCVTLSKPVNSTTKQVAMLFIYRADRVRSWREMWRRLDVAFDKAGD